MKKIISFVIALFGCMTACYPDNDVVQKKNQAMTTQFLEADCLAKEYDYSQEQDADINEYDHHVCDSVTPPKISEIRAFFERVMTHMLIYYFTFKETAHQYAQKLKKIINKWLHSDKI